MTIDFSGSPFFDDYTESKSFYRILFTNKRRAVQIRELNQIQSILQNQISRVGHHLFVNGSMVLPGGISFDNKVSYCKLTSTADLLSETYRNSNLLGKVIRGTSGVEGRIVKTVNDSGSIVIYLKYTKSNGAVSTLSNSELFYVLDDTGGQTAITASLISSNSTGSAALATIEEGVYFIKDRFCLVNPQSILLSSYSATPSKKVGLVVTESIITSDDDNSLLDNVLGMVNRTAPGADRYKIELVLTSLDLNTSVTASENFIELLRVESGEITKKIDKSTYAVLGETLARRTYDESGDYTVTPFDINLIDFYNDLSNGGRYLPANFDYTTSDEAKAVSIARFGVGAPGTYHQVSANYRPGSNPTDLINLMKSKLVAVISSGKAYVKGYEIEKISNTYLDVDKARDLSFANNATLKCSIGNYIRVSKLYSLPDIKNMTVVDLHDGIVSSNGTASGSKIGTARVRGIELETGTVGDATCIYRLYLFDVQMNSGKQFYNVKSIYDSSTTPDFTCNLVLEQVALSGTVSASASTTLTGIGSFFKTDTNLFLSAGDYIKIGSTYHKIASVTNDTTLVLSASTSCSSANYYYVYASLYEVYNSAAIFPLPNVAIQKIKDANNTVDTNYVVRRAFSAQVVGSSSATFTCSTDEEFLSISPQNYLIRDESDGAIIVPAGSITGGTSITFTGLTNGHNVSLVGSVRKKQGSPSTQKTKSLVAGATINTVNNVEDLNEVSLGKADIIRVQGIYMSSNFTTNATTSSTNITDNYTLDNGQRDSFYGVGKIIRNKNAPVPTGKLHVVFDYYSHGANGNYFSVDSYTGASVSYDDIPTYTSVENGATYQLRDCLDFRPRLDDTGANFSGTGSSSVEFPKDGAVYADYFYYLNRIDKVYLSNKGEFGIVKGVSADDPKQPPSPSDGMVTHWLQIKAYTLSPDKVFRNYYDNRRYTMRDIGHLATRIDNLEYYTSLSLLEKSVDSLAIKDADGLDRFKNGFIVDNFTGHGVGDVLARDYRCSVDMEEKELRSTFVENNIKLIEDPTVTSDSDPDSVRTSAGYQKTGDLITLPYDSAVTVNSQVASSKINVNPFNVINFLGILNINPPEDEWKDTARMPDLIVNQEGNYDTIKQLTDGIGTIWNEWNTNWSGSVVTNSTTTVSREAASVPMLHRDLDGAITTSGPLAGVFSGANIEWPTREVTTTRTTQTKSGVASRTGIVTKVVPYVSKTSLGDKVVNVAYIPYIRSREIQLRATGLKPNTKVYPFFDDINVSAHTTAWADPEVAQAFNTGNVVSTGTAMVSDSFGKVSATLKIPNTNSLKFKTGTKLVEVIDNATNDRNNFTTMAAAQYRATGIKETVQNTIVSTRNAKVTTESIVENKAVTDTTVSEAFSYGQWVDPIAETILITDKGGAFITSVDLFMASRDNNIPLQVQIRETVNGYPGQKIVPFADIHIEPKSKFFLSNITGSFSVGETITGGTSGATAKILSKESSNRLYVDQLTGTFFVKNETITGGTSGATGKITTLIEGVNTNNVVNGNLIINGITSISSYDSGDLVPTKVIFESPVYLQEGKEYAIVILANSDRYESWIATMGESEIGSNIPVQKQPYAGSFFKSQNGSTWSADQYSDLCFRLNKAVFETSTTGIVTFTNDSIPSKLLSSNPVTTKSGSAIVRIYHQNHGMPEGSSVSLSGIVDTNGISGANINGTKTISNVELDSYLVTASNSDTASSSGTGGGSACIATENYQLDTGQLVSTELTLPATTLKYDIKSTSGKSVHGGQTPYVIDGSYSYITSNENVEFGVPKLIASAINESVNTGGVKSLNVRAVLASTNANVSPAIDLARFSFIAVGNRIDNPSYTGTYDINHSVLDTDTIAISSSISHSASGTILSVDAAVSKKFAQLQVGKYIDVSNCSVSANNTRKLVTGVSYADPNCTISVAGGTSLESAGNIVTVKSLNRYVSEIAEGSSSAKYLMKRMQLALPSNAAKIRFAANRNPDSSILVYYKTITVDNSSDWSSTLWTLATPDQDVIASSNTSEFKEYNYTINSMKEFIAISTKIVFLGSNTATPPRIRELVAIAITD